MGHQPTPSHHRTEWARSAQTLLGGRHHPNSGTTLLGTHAIEAQQGRARQSALKFARMMQSISERDSEPASTQAPSTRELTATQPPESNDAAASPSAQAKDNARPAGAAAIRSHAPLVTAAAASAAPSPVATKAVHVDAAPGSAQQTLELQLREPEQLQLAHSFMRRPRRLHRRPFWPRDPE